MTIRNDKTSNTPASRRPDLGARTGQAAPLATSPATPAERVDRRHRRRSRRGRKMGKVA